jgi:hypothetical protein
MTAPLALAALVFAVLFGAALLGMWLRPWLPEHHLNAETKDAVRIGMGSVATMAALVLGLLVASTKTAYDAEKNEVMQLAAKITYLSHLLVNYGPDTMECRVLLRDAVLSARSRIWAEADTGEGTATPATIWGHELPQAIQKLAPQSEAQHTFKAQAAQLANELGQTRWLLFEQMQSSVSTPLLVIMVLWLALTSMSIGLFAPPNAMAVTAQVLAALAVAGALFLILEQDHPFAGLIRISSQPMRNALSYLPQVHQ